MLLTRFLGLCYIIWRKAADGGLFLHAFRSPGVPDQGVGHDDRQTGRGDTSPAGEQCHPPPATQEPHAAPGRSGYLTGCAGMTLLCDCAGIVYRHSPTGSNQL